MKTQRITNTLKNARLTLFFNALLLIVNFFSREVFITHLGNEFLGLYGSVVSYIGFLNLAELGIGTALTQALYKPIVENNRERITQMVSLISFLFRWVGIAIGTVGIILACFMPSIMAGQGVDTTAIITTFLTMLATTMLSYLINYKQILLLAAQQNYIVTRIYNTTLVAKFIIQIVLLYYFDLGYMWWLVCELLFAVSYAAWLYLTISRKYPWLNSSYSQGKRTIKEHKALLHNAKNIFLQHISGKVLLQSDNIVIQNILGLVNVTYFINYTMLMQRISSLLIGSLSASSAGIGHLVVSGDRDKIELVFRQFNALYFWLGGFMAFGFFTCVNPLLNLWLTDKLIYGDWIVLLLSVNLFISIVGRPSEYFLNAYGLYGDVWASWTQMFLNLGLSVWLTVEYGIVGVVIGTAVSTTLHTLVWKPYYLCKRGLGSSPWMYWGSILKFVMVIGVSWICVTMLVRCGFFVNPQTWLGLVIYGGSTAVIYGLLSGLLMWLLSKGMRSLVTLGMKIKNGTC